MALVIHHPARVNLRGCYVGGKTRIGDPVLLQSLNGDLQGAKADRYCLVARQCRLGCSYAAETQPWPNPPAVRNRTSLTAVYAARTPTTKLLTSLVSCSAWRERSLAAPNTCPAAAPVSLAARLTPAMMAVTSCVLAAVC